MQTIASAEQMVHLLQPGQRTLWPHITQEWALSCPFDLAVQSVSRSGIIHDQTAVQAFEVSEFPACGIGSASEHRNAADGAGFCGRLNTGRRGVHGAEPRLTLPSDNPIRVCTDLDQNQACASTRRADVADVN